MDMKRVYIEDLINKAEFLETEVELKGWIYKITKMGKVAFVMLRDKSGVIQLVVDDVEDIKEYNLETCIGVKGLLVSNPKARGKVEVQVKDIDLISKTHYDLLPFSINGKEIQASLEKELDFRTISLRRPNRRAVFRIQEEIVESFRTYLRSLDFSEIHTPKIIDSATEGGSEVFTLNYFEQRAFLAQSPQFYKQMMVGAGFERVFEIGNAYRAELHNTWRHLNEYVSLDVEMGFIDDEFDIMDVEEGFIKFLFEQVRKNCKKELDMYGIDLPVIKEIPRIPLNDARDILLEKFDKLSPPGNIDAEGEKIFSKYIKDEYDSDFVFLTKYPAAKRPVYTMPDGELEGMTKSFDLIYKGLEITTGGQRIHDYEMLMENMTKGGMKPEDFAFYTDTFKYGMPPHGGFAIGLERITMKILDLENIRQSTLLPRDMGRITP